MGRIEGSNDRLAAEPWADCDCMTELDPLTGVEKVLIHSGDCPEHPDYDDMSATARGQ